MTLKVAIPLDSTLFPSFPAPAPPRLDLSIECCPVACIITDLSIDSEQESEKNSNLEILTAV